MPFLTTTIAAYTAHNTSANPSYNQTNFPSPNFTGTTYISAHPLVSEPCNPALTDDSFNPITPCHVSPVSVKTMVPSYSGKRVILVVPYNFSGSGSGSGGHVNFGMNTDSTAWVSAACESMQARGYDGLTVDWYGPDRYEDSVTQLIKPQCESMTGFTFAIMIDTSGGSYSTLAELESYLSYLQANYFGSSAYRKWDGKCIVYMWGPTVLTDSEYATAKASISTPMYWIGQGPGSLSMSSMDAAFDWVQPYSSGVNEADPYNLAAKTSFIDSCAASSKGSVLAISCGFNGTLTLTTAWSEGKYIPRNSGECWIQQSSLVNSNISHIQSGGGTLVEIQDATWNDWQEGTEMEDAIDNSIAVSASLTGSVVSWSVSGGTGDESTLSEYILLATPDGVNAAVLGTQATGGSNSFDLSTVSGWAAGTTYTIYVIAQGIPNVRSQWNNSLTYAPSGTVTLTSIAVTPNPVTLARGGTQQFIATGTYSDGSVANDTALASWSSSDSSIATVSNVSGTVGVATGVSVGSATVTATLSGISGTASLTIYAPSPALNAVTQTYLVPLTVRKSKFSSTDQQHILSLDSAQPLNTVDTSAGSFSQPLPPAGANQSTGQSNQGREFIFKKVSSDANTFALTGAVNGTQILAAQYSKVRVHSDGTQWWVVG